MNDLTITIDFAQWWNWLKTDFHWAYIYVPLHLLYAVVVHYGQLFKASAWNKMSARERELKASQHNAAHPKAYQAGASTVGTFPLLLHFFSNLLLGLPFMIGRKLAVIGIFLVTGNLLRWSTTAKFRMPHASFTRRDE